MALNFDEVKEKFKSEVTKIYEKIQDTSIYHQLKDRYENLSPSSQKITLVFVFLVLFAIVGSIPFTSFMNSSDLVGSFEDKRNLIRDLFKVQQETQNISGLTPTPPIEALKSRIDDELKYSQILPEQVRSINIDSPPPMLPRTGIDGALRVNLAKLNLRQIVDIGYQIQAISPGIKITDMIIETNLQDARYFDVIYKLIALKIPNFSVADSDIEEPSMPNKKNKSLKPNMRGEPH